MTGRRCPWDTETLLCFTSADDKGGKDGGSSEVQVESLEAGLNQFMHPGLLIAGKIYSSRCYPH